MGNFLYNGTWSDTAGMTPQPTTDNFIPYSIHHNQSPIQTADRNEATQDAVKLCSPYKPKNAQK